MIPFLCNKGRIDLKKASSCFRRRELLSEHRTSSKHLVSLHFLFNWIKKMLTYVTFVSEIKVKPCSYTTERKTALRRQRKRKSHLSNEKSVLFMLSYRVDCNRLARWFVHLTLLDEDDTHTCILSRRVRI